MILVSAPNFCLAAGVASRPFTIAVAIPPSVCSCAATMQEAQEAVLHQPAAEPWILSSWKGENSCVFFSVSREKCRC